MYLRFSRVIIAATFLLAIAMMATLATQSGRSLAWAAYTRMHGRASIEDRLGELSIATQRIRDRCARAGLPFPPETVTLVAIKDVRLLLVYGGPPSSLRLVAEFPILGASGTSGPKRYAGDGQVPEGIYGIESLNPNSRFHLALRVDYPNASDRRWAQRDGRTDLGGDIMIHGGNASTGCLAMGDPVIEELFSLVAAVGVERTKLVTTPTADVAAASIPSGAPSWVAELYGEIERELLALENTSDPPKSRNR
jgi:hypothetical protein